MSLQGFIQRLPQVLIGDGLLVGGLPVPGLPALKIFRHTFLDIRRISVQHDMTGLLQRRQRGDDGLQLHAIVRRARLMAGQHFFVLTSAQHCRPTAGTGIGIARAIGVDDHFGSIAHDDDLCSATFDVLITPGSAAGLGPVRKMKIQ